MQQENQGTFHKIWKRFSTLTIFCLLLLTLIISSGEMLQGQMLRMGEKMFGNPAEGIQYSYLRADPAKPTCDTNPNVDAAVQQKMKEQSASDDEFAGLFDDAVDENAVRQSILSGVALCKEQHEMYGKISSQITPGVRAYRTVETALLYITRLGVDWRQVLLMFILAIAAINTTLGLHHIALRPPSSKRDFQVYSLSMVVANALMLFSTGSYLQSLITSDIAAPITQKTFHALWVTVFATLLIISVIKLIKPPKTTELGSWAKAGLSVPLYANMAIITGIAFIFFLDYKTGIGIYLGQMEELSNIFLNLSLFIWIGMMLKQTNVVDKFLDIVRPFNFSPESLSIILMIAAGVLTAYTGASGIFVIAAGAIIYREVYNSGARRQYALAMTAMSGSLGVVLRPCLLIVVIAALNNKVTTDALYGHGMYVFIVSTSLLYIFSLVLAESKFKLRSPMAALPQSFVAFKGVAAYIIIAVVVIGFYRFGLETKLSEFTASLILPFVMLFILFYEKVINKKATSAQAVTADNSMKLNVPNVDNHAEATASKAKESSAQNERDAYEADHLTQKTSFFGSVSEATYETIGHIGALIMLMGLSISVGGLIERTEIMHVIPAEFGSTLMAIMLFTFVLVIIGMIMDPFGAAILVNATIAPIAYQNGIHPVHFWIIVLAAFELGYLSPPVALNQLLARQVVGEKEIAEADAEVRHKSFYWRYERWILPFVIMLITLLIVAYIPYFFKLFNWY